MKFELIHILGVMTIAAIFIVGAVTLLGPTFKLAAEIRLKKDRVLHQLDHSKIAVAAIELLASAPNGLLEDADIPPAIKDGEPKFVNIAYECATIEYGGGFAHYGLIIDPTGRHHVTMPSLPPNVDYTETDLGNGVFFYESE